MSAQLKMVLIRSDARLKKFSLLRIVAVIATLLLITVAWQSVKATQTTPATEQTGQGAQASQPAVEAAFATSIQTNDVIATTLSPSGFSPNELSHAPGRFNLRVNNQSGQPKVTLRLSKSGGEKLTEVPLTDKVRWVTAPVELAPGSYTLTVAGHPDRTCQITIQ